MQISKQMKVIDLKAPILEKPTCVLVQRAPLRFFVCQFAFFYLVNDC